MKEPAQTDFSLDARGFRRAGVVAGLLLGIFAPAGCLVIRYLLNGEPTLVWMLEEWNQQEYFYLYMLISIPIAFGVFGYFLGSLRDRVLYQNIALERMNTTLKTQSLTDDVTGQYNHRFLVSEIEKSLERAVRNKRDLSALMIDLDDFKQVNDRFGHLTGDRVLKELADIVNQSIRKVDTLGRYGGDEFLVILPEAAPEAAARVARRIQQNVSQHRFNVGKKTLPITVSIGITTVPDIQKIDKTDFIESVDQAMFKAKKSGKNRIIVGGQGPAKDPE